MTDPSGIATGLRAAGRALGTEGGMLTASFALMASALHADHGHFSLRALALLLASAACLVAAARRRIARPREDAAPDLAPLLAVALVILLVVGGFAAPGYDLRDDGTFRAAYIALQLALAVAVSAVFLGGYGGTRARLAVGIVGVAVGFGLRIGIVVASPAPVIDVFTQFQESAAHLLAGLNPYTTPVSDPSEAWRHFGYTVTGYAYPPASIYAQTAAYILLGDIRYAYLAAEAVAVGALLALAWRAARPAAWLLALLFLFHPRGLFEIEQAWNEPLLVGAGGAFLWLAATRPDSRWVPVVFGAFLALKQYLVFFAALFVVPRAHRRMVPAVVAVVALTWLPFIVWDARAALENGLLFQFRTPFRPDGLTLAALAHHWFGWTTTKWVAIGTGAVVATLAGRRLCDGSVSGYLYASVSTTLAVFLVGSQAFCNYYYFLGAMILFLLALRLRETAAGGAETP